MMDVLNFSPAVLVLLGISLLFAVAAIAIGLRPLWLTSTLPLPESDADKNKNVGKVSVLVYAHSELESIPQYLSSLLAQDYPDFEVIVVFSASAAATAVLTEEIASAPNLYITFIPPGSHNLSRRKLALTIGMKAAKGDVVLFTSSNCVIPSGHWISDMVAPFADKGIDLSLGFSYINPEELSGIGKWYRRFNFLLSSCSWIGAAREGATYRGDGLNMALRKSVFFAHKGFAKSLNLHLGDDDLFVYEVAIPSNVALCISPQTNIISEWGSQANRTMSIFKAQYDFTRRWLPKKPFLRAGFASLSQWITLLSGIAACIIGYPSWIPIVAAIIILFAFWGVETALYRKAASRLDQIRLFWSVAPFMLWRPVGNCIFRLRHRSERYSHFTWNRHRAKAKK